MFLQDSSAAKKDLKFSIQQSLTRMQYAAAADLSILKKEN